MKENDAQPTAQDSSHDNAQPMSQEQQDAILSLIGIWKTDQILNEKQILDEERMKKYG